MARKYFYCDRWRIMMAEDACINRYKKGLAKCAGCEEGARRAAALLETRKSKLEIGEAHGIHNDGD